METKEALSWAWVKAMYEREEIIKKIERAESHNNERYLKYLNERLEYYGEIMDVFLKLKPGVDNIKQK